MAYIPKKRTKYLPYLEFYLNIPLVTIQTVALRGSYERYTFDIFRLRVRLWKWSTEFDLYKKF